jgi:hypothetical protein
LHLLNGNLLNAKVANKDGRLGQLIVSGMSDREIVAEFYIRGFGRPPTDRELTDWATRLGKGERRLVLEDFLWGLLNSREFGTNH